MAQSPNLLELVKKEHKISDEAFIKIGWKDRQKVDLNGRGLKSRPNVYLDGKVGLERRQDIDLDNKIGLQSRQKHDPDGKIDPSEARSRQ